MTTNQVSQGLLTGTGPLVNPHFVSHSAAAPEPAMAPAPQDRVEMGQAASDAPSPGLSLGKKVALAAATVISVGTPLGNTWAAAMAPPQTTLSQDLEAMHAAPMPRVGYVKPGTFRVELASRAEATGRPARSSDPSPSDIGVNLGHNLFLDQHGNLSLVTQNGGEIQEFQQLKNEGLFPEVSMKAVRSEGMVRVTGPRGVRSTFAERESGVTIRSHEGPYAISAGADQTFIVGPGGVSDQYHVTWQGNTATVTLPDQGTITVETDGRHATVTNPQGERHEYYLTDRLAINNDASIKLDGDVQATAAEKAIATLEAKLEKIEPGYVKTHPVSMAVMESMMRDTDASALIDAQARLNGLEVASLTSAAVSGVHTGLALVGRSTALGLASDAMALKNGAMAAKDAAMVAAHAGNYGQAGQLANQAGTLAGQAKATGAQAMQAGETAKAAAEVGRISIGVAGALAVVDGALQAYHGYENVENIEKAQALATATLQRVAELETPDIYQYARADFENVSKTLAQLHEYHEDSMTIGGVKITCGGLMIASALAGGVLFPPVIGAVGSACYLGVTIYEHYRSKPEGFSTPLDRQENIEVAPAR